MITRSGPVSLRAAAALLAVAGLALTGCATEEDEVGAEIEDPGGAPLEPPEATEPYVGDYDAAFTETVLDYADQEVSLIGEVDTVVSPVAFTLTAPDDSPIEPLLIIHDPIGNGLTEGAAVEVTGLLREAYNVPSVEENLGGPPGEEVLAHYDGEPFVGEATVTPHPSGHSTSTG